MSARILDGKKIAAELQQEIRDDVTKWTSESRVQPLLAAVLVGDDPASNVYVRNKQRACRLAGIGSRLIRLPTTTTTGELLEQIANLNSDDEVSGILVQLPLPSGIDTQAVLLAIDPAKDVDGFHPCNVGLLMQGRGELLPCTPHGVIQILGRCNIPVAGKRVCVIGRSDIVGKPLAAMLMQRTGTLGPDYANATVTVCHSRTDNLAEVIRENEVVIAAIGQPEFVRAEMIRPGAVVIDVGINRIGDRLVGDVDYAPVSEIAGAITPVPGGVGPLTVTMLLANTLLAAQNRLRARPSKVH